MGFVWGERRSSVVLQLEALLALPCSGFIVFTFMRFRQLQRELAFHLVLNMALADIGSLVAMSLGSPDDQIDDAPWLCTLQAFMIQFFNLASLFWATSMAVAMRHVVEKQRRIAIVWPFHLFSWGFSFTLALLPLTTHSYGPAGTWCWIELRGSDPFLNTIWRTLLFHVPVWLCIMRVCMHYCVTSRRLADIAAQAGERDRWRRLEGQLRLYPLIMIVAWSGELAFRCREYAHPDADSEPRWLALVQVVVGNGSFIQSVANSLVYGTSPTVRRLWARAWREACEARSLGVLFCPQPHEDADELRSYASSLSSAYQFHPSFVSSGKQSSDRSGDDALEGLQPHDQPDGHAGGGYHPPGAFHPPGALGTIIRDRLSDSDGERVSDW